MGMLSDMLIEKCIHKNLLMNFLEYTYCRNIKENEYEHG